ncbi:sigma-70 family RNA polymerase sigma factor [Limnohabitans sp.]|jgi:RNA polymerase sigma-70 factor (ECF subfamily)|uniref:sigma-70 family RNA polymerase sigma factor n=1 Tax=Limnohabitans sp. TaxID=1907725 RepID=UPI00260EDEBA|nr:sigma-70 family RNA polymerase sigma factor [Limnohabitans sp.]
MSESLATLETQLHGLWMRSLNGDSACYERALTLLSGYLRGFLRNRLQSRLSDVEDLVQEILMAIHQKRHTYQSDQPLTAWAYAIARYKWVDHLRAHGRRESLHEDIDDWSETLLVEGEHEASDTQRDLEQVLAELPAKQREAIEHTRLQGLSISETAERTGQSEASVKVNIHRGLKTLMAKWGVQK